MAAGEGEGAEIYVVNSEGGLPSFCVLINCFESKNGCITNSFPVSIIWIFFFRKGAGTRWVNACPLMQYEASFHRFD